MACACPHRPPRARGRDRRPRLRPAGEPFESINPAHGAHKSSSSPASSKTMIWSGSKAPGTVVAWERWYSKVLRRWKSGASLSAWVFLPGPRGLARHHSHAVSALTPSRRRQWNRWVLEPPGNGGAPLTVLGPRPHAVRDQLAKRDVRPHQMPAADIQREIFESGETLGSCALRQRLGAACPPLRRGSPGDPGTSEGSSSESGAGAPSGSRESVFPPRDRAALGDSTRPPPRRGSAGHRPAGAPS